MKKRLQFSLTQMRLAFIPLLLLLAQYAWSQCNNTAPFGSTTAPTTATPVTITTCAYGGEYNTINSCVAGSTYLFTGSGGTGNYLTVRQGTPGGTVLAAGFSPLSATCTVSGPLYLHVNTNAACGTESVCHTTTVACSSCGGGGSSSNCTNGSIYPSVGISLATANSGTVQTISTCNYAGEYYGVTGVLSGSAYTFTSSGAGDYITVRSGISTGPVVGQGTSPLTINTSSTADLFVHINLGTACGSQSACRTTTVVRVTCANSSAFPSTATSLTPTNTSGTTQTITSCNYAGEYFQVNNVIAGNPYQFTSSISTDFITVRVGTFNGAILGSGTTPLTVTPTASSDLFVHINTNAACGTQSSCRITTARCTTCTPSGSAPACATAPTAPANGANAGCPNNTQTLSWPAVATATSYDVYFGTTTTPVFVANVATTSYTTGVLASGTYYWQILPRNSFGVAAGCTVWSFSRIDNTPPTITCPASVTANNSPATACSAVVTYGSITANDNCSPPSIVLQSGLASASTFPVGVTTIVYRATDGSNNTATCSFTVTVNDATPPTITCPANITANNNPATACSAVVNHPAVTATDNCAAPTLAQLSGLPSGATYPVGTTTNVWRATDAAGRTATCSFTVKVNDATPPSITCPGNIETGNDWNKCGKTLTFIGTPTVGDNCGVSQLSTNSPVNFPLGTTTVTYTLKDGAGNSTTCQQTVTINDIQPPSISCPGNIVTLTDLGDCAATVNFSVNASDNCPGFTVEYSQAPQTSFALGFTGVSATVTDAEGLSASCSFLIQVKERKETCNGFDDDCDGLVDETEDWTPVGKRFASNGGAQDAYGGSVDIDGDWAIVGSNHKSQGQSVGTAYILSRDPEVAGSWQEVALLLPASVQPGDNFGASVAISEGLAAVGAPQDDEGAPNGGAVYIFKQEQSNPAQWNFVKKVLPADPSSAANFGSSVSLDAGRLLVGAVLDDAAGTNSGAAYLFARNLGGPENWGQVTKMVANDGGSDDQFGVSVSLSGASALVGAAGDDDKGANAGAAYVFGQNTGGAGAWGQQGKLVAGNGQAGDNAGLSVSLSGNYAMVGAEGSDLKASNAGAVFVFTYGGNGWQQQGYIVEYNGADDDHFGHSVSLDGDYAAVGAPGDDPYGNNSGRAFAFLRVSNGWAQVGVLSDGSGKSNDALGNSIAISGRTIIAGVPNDDVVVNSDQGSVMIYAGVCADAQPRDVDGEATVAADKGLQVECFPVPFNDQLTVRISAQAAEVRIQCTNALGQVVANLFEGALDGTAQYTWETARMQPGVYFLRVQADGQVTTKAVLLTR